MATTARTVEACAILEWTHAPDPADGTTYVVDYAIVLREPDEPVRLVHDQHTLGLFPEATWHNAIAEAGLELVSTRVENPFTEEQATFVARRGASTLAP